MSKFRGGHRRSAKLKVAEVLDLRTAYAQGATQGDLARKYGISVGQIGKIVRGEAWASVTEGEHADPESFAASGPGKERLSITDEYLKDAASLSIEKFKKLNPDIKIEESLPIVTRPPPAPVQIESPIEKEIDWKLIEARAKEKQLQEELMPPPKVKLPPKTDGEI